jgi:hypothetical protein
MEFVQINLHHSKAATAVLCQQLAEGMTDVALIQEPWIYRDQIRCITNPGGTIFSVAPEGNVRSAFMSGIILTPYVCWSSVPWMQKR